MQGPLKYHPDFRFHLKKKQKSDSTLRVPGFCLQERKKKKKRGKTGGCLSSEVCQLFSTIQVTSEAVMPKP